MNIISKPKWIKRKLNGVLLFDKPKDISSNNVLQKVRRLFQAEKAGHTGNLDPIATGLLPICFGEATKFAQYLLDSDKAYRATVQLGRTTTTGDSEGETKESFEIPADINLEKIKAVLESLIGTMEQIPPMHSALKHQGKALYEYAREGIEIERKARIIQIYRIDFINYDKNSNQILIDVYCSKGTYIRVLSEKIGELLNCGAFMQELRRLESGGFLLENAINLEQLEAIELFSDRDQFLLPIDCLLNHFEKISLNKSQVFDFKLGRSIKILKSDLNYLINNIENLIKIYDAEHQLFLGLAKIEEYQEDSYLIFPKRVVVY